MYLISTFYYPFVVSNTPRATPYMAHQKRVNINTGDTNEDVESNLDNGSSDKKQLGNHPRGINRLSSKLNVIITLDRTRACNFLVFSGG